MSLSVNPHIKDDSYRYKMDPIDITQTGSGKNCHTIINNIDTIAHQLNTESFLLIGYIGWCLGASTNENSIKGHFPNDKIQAIIYDFIVFATMCKKCTIPELAPTVIGKGKKMELKMYCSACGSTYTLEGNNKMNMKLVDIMCKHYSVTPFVPKDGSTCLI